MHRTDQPDYSFLPDQDFDWTYSCKVMSMKAFLMTCHVPLGKAVVTTTTMDAILNNFPATG